jgi:hypothetical protein
MIKDIVYKLLELFLINSFFIKIQFFYKNKKNPQIFIFCGF